jgi:A/G-specific adenine glycosylase
MHYAEIARRLAAWHNEQQRVLPWRAAPAGRRDPYTVWVSEIMAQQTRLDTAAGYFTRWMARFPTLEALAAADQQDVLKAWEGLGYYARARNLHRAAQIVAEAYGGRLPRTRRELLKLPGIGEYSAGAILSLAFGLREPILDGNVKRVFSRLADIDSPIEDRATLQRLWDMARSLVEAGAKGQAGAVNEALMELGALVCTPGRPRCLACPLHDLCAAAALGVQAQRPVRLPRRKTPHYDVAAGVIWQGEAYASPLLIAQRPADGMLGGLWEFPGGKLEPYDADLQACLRREIAEELAVGIEVHEPLTTVRHAYTHFRITLHVFHARWLAGVPQALGCADWRWARLDQLAEYPFPVTDQKIIQSLAQAEDSP